MEIGLIVISVIGLVLLVVLFWEAREYGKHTKVIANYIETAQQFIIAFETTKGALNRNADIQRETIDNVNVCAKNIEVIFGLLSLHDRALDLDTVSSIRRVLNAPLLQPKKQED